MTNFKELVNRVVQSAMARADLLRDAKLKGSQLDWDRANAADEEIVASTEALRSAAMDYAISTWRQMAAEQGGV